MPKPNQVVFVPQSNNIIKLLGCNSINLVLENYFWSRQIQLPKGVLCCGIRHRGEVTNRRYVTSWDEDTLNIYERKIGVNYGRVKKNDVIIGKAIVE